MKLKVGKFIRTDKGKIYKIKNVKEPMFNIGCSGIKQFGDFENKEHFITHDYDNLIEISGTKYKYKSNFNLIELLEVGDFIDKYLITEINENGYLFSNGKLLYSPSDEIQFLEILTKEQYQNNVYTVKE